MQPQVKDVPDCPAQGPGGHGRGHWPQHNEVQPGHKTTLHFTAHVREWRPGEVTQDQGHSGQRNQVSSSLSWEGDEKDRQGAAGLT